ncbi:MAG TPA: radical SAM protein [Anaerolineales bacterium]|nr:radical SAM protein [Anaerolineales bacterium]
MAKIHYARVNEHNEILLPPNIAKQLGLVPGDEIRIEPNGRGLHLHPSIHTLKRVYVELTNKCNLTCSTCMRNVWDVKYGNMSDAVFGRVLTGLEDCAEKPELFLGGYGEPLSHPKVLKLIEQAKGRGHRVSLITNGILLTEAVANKLIDVNLDMLWVSLDGASAECYSDVRLGDSLPLILENLTRLRALKYQRFGISNWSGHPKLGIAFVAMRRNIHDLGQVIHLGTRLGAVEFSITNVLAHNTELLNENLYMRSLDMVAGREIRPTVHMPLVDIRPETLKALGEVLKDLNQVELTGSPLNRNIDQCPFVERGSMSIRWDGKVSPCLPLLYTHRHYLGDRERTSKEYFVGDIHQSTLMQIWNDQTYHQLRKRLQEFDFSPCAFCNSCEMAIENVEDCFGNLHPTCGGCLWAQGLIRCP